MEWNQNTYDMWMLFAASMQSQAIWFASCAFLIWVGFRFTNNIYNDSSTPVIAKVLATGFCGSVALFTLGVLETEDYLNDNIEGRYFKKDFGF